MRGARNVLEKSRSPQGFVIGLLALSIMNVKNVFN